MRHLILLALFGVFFVCVGCGNPKVTGTVKFSDGTPLIRGTVNFQTSNHAAMGAVDKDGKFTIGGERAGDGVPPGTYQVFITGAMGFDTSKARTLEFGGGPGTTVPIIPLIDKKYERPETSGLTCEVKGSTVYDITVMKPGEKQ